MECKNAKRILKTEPKLEWIKSTKTDIVRRALNIKHDCVYWKLLNGALKKIQKIQRYRRHTPLKFSKVVRIRENVLFKDISFNQRTLSCVNTFPPVT